MSDAPAGGWCDVGAARQSWLEVWSGYFLRRRRSTGRGACCFLVAAIRSLPHWRAGSCARPLGALAMWIAYLPFTAAFRLVLPRSPRRCSREIVLERFRWGHALIALLRFAAAP
jgi:hypothetical protein